jgi:mannose-1-phosphate guanylyltransferase
LYQPHSVRLFYLVAESVPTFDFLGWDDVGDFGSLADLLPAESNSSVVLGDSNLGRFTRNSYLFAQLTDLLSFSRH